MAGNKNPARRASESSTVDFVNLDGLAALLSYEGIDELPESEGWYTTAQIAASLRCSGTTARKYIKQALADNICERGCTKSPGTDGKRYCCVKYRFRKSQT